MQLVRTLAKSATPKNTSTPCYSGDWRGDCLGPQDQRPAVGRSRTARDLLSEGCRVKTHSMPASLQPRLVKPQAHGFPEIHAPCHRAAGSQWWCPVRGSVRLREVRMAISSRLSKPPPSILNLHMHELKETPKEPPRSPKPRLQGPTVSKALMPRLRLQKRPRLVVVTTGIARHSNVDVEGFSSIVQGPFLQGVKV